MPHQGVEFERVLWQILAHVVNHGTQHRAEAALLLTEMGYSSGDVDLIYFLAERYESPGWAQFERG